MAEVAESSTPPGIAALPPTTVRQIGSHQLLTDPSSVVKELIDNALDARAKSIFVDITANTIDFIQVKDDGHGIPNEDRALACRRYCTSKIRDFHDLKEVGGKWLGFRGEALASIADMSGTVSITTRVEGEPVAVKLTYQRSGELTSWVDGIGGECCKSLTSTQNRTRLSSCRHYRQGHQLVRVSKSSQRAGSQKFSKMSRKDSTSHASLCTCKTRDSLQTAHIEGEEQQGRLRLRTKGQRQRRRCCTQDLRQRMRLAV